MKKETPKIDTMKKLESLRKRELIELITAIRPKSDAYDRVCKELGIENNILGFVKNLIIPWLSISEELPEYGETVLTYTPPTEMAEEQIRLIRYGSMKSGFPAGVTHWKYLDKPTCV